MIGQEQAIRWWPIVLCALAVLLDGYDAQMLAMAIPLMAREFDVPPTAFAMAASSSLAGMAIGALLLSPFADRIGRRAMLVVSLVLFGLPTLIAMQADSPLEMAIWRLVAGCGLGATVPVTIGITTELAPPGRRISIAALAASGFAIGASSAGLLTPLLAQYWGWRGMFAYGGIAPLFIAVLVWRGIPDAASPAQPQAAAKAGLPRPGLLFVSGRWPRTVLLWAINAINLFANYGFASWLPTLMVQNGWTLPSASRLMAVLSIGAVSGSFLVSRLVDRGQLVKAFAGGYLIAALALVLCATNPASPVVWALLLVMIGFGAIGTQLTLGPLAASLYPPEARSTGVGWASGLGRTGSLFGPLAMAWLMNQHLAPTHVIGALTVPMLACAVCVVLLSMVLRRGKEV